MKKYHQKPVYLEVEKKTPSCLNNKKKYDYELKLSRQKKRNLIRKSNHNHKT